MCKLSSYMQSIHPICYVKSPSLCKVSTQNMKIKLPAFLQSLRHCLSKVSTFIQTIHPPLCSNVFTINTKIYKYVTYHLYIITLVNITHYCRKCSPSSSSADTARSSNIFKFFSICSYHTSLPLRHPSNNFLAVPLSCIFDS